MHDPGNLDRATGIGCFFDDPVHQVFGFKDLAFQSLYHLTAGATIAGYSGRISKRSRRWEKWPHSFRQLRGCL